MEEQNVVYVEKKNGFWKFVKVALVVAAAAYVAVKVYQKYFKKVEVEIDDAEELDAELEPIEIELSDDTAQEDAFEASAEAVIANAEEMDTLTEEA